MGMPRFNLSHKLLSFLIVGLCLVLAGCGDSIPPPPTTERLGQLATDVHVKIGGQPLTLPLVALPDYAHRGTSFSLDRARDQSHEREAVGKLLSGTAINPLIFKKISVEVRMYGSTDENLRYMKMCPLFPREWERSVCRDSWSAILLALPSNPFSIVDFSQKLSVQKDGRLDCVKGSGAIVDLLPKQKGEIAILCIRYEPREKSPAVYLAAMRIEGDLGVLWSVWEDRYGRESIDKKVQREGEALATFVENALGLQENFSKLHADMCQLRRPGSYENAHFVDCPR